MLALPVEIRYYIIIISSAVMLALPVEIRYYIIISSSIALYLYNVDVQMTHESFILYIVIYDAK